MSEKRTWRGVKGGSQHQGSPGAVDNYQRIEKESRFGATVANVGLREHIHV